jgi:hypothetical protein
MFMPENNHRLPARSQQAIQRVPVLFCPSHAPHNHKHNHRQHKAGDKQANSGSDKLFDSHKARANFLSGIPVIENNLIFRKHKPQFFIACFAVIVRRNVIIGKGHASNKDTV